MSSSAYRETLVAASIFVPLTIAIVLAWFFLRGAKNDPDEQRHRQAQRAAEQADRDASPKA
jgi:hypothetical protein